MPTNAGGTGAIGGDLVGKLVTELASGRNSHGGGRYFAGSANRFRRGMFFVRGFDTYHGPLPEVPKPRRPIQGFVVEALNGGGRSIPLTYLLRWTVQLNLRIRDC